MSSGFFFIFVLIISVMGIKNKFWHLIEPTTEIVNFYDDATGQTVAFDPANWFADGAAHATEMLFGNDTNVVKAFGVRLTKVLDEGIIPFFVFDGTRPVAKGEVDADRDSTRVQAREKALLYHQAGDKVNAEKWAKRAISISPSLIYKVIHTIIRPKGIGYWRADEEADGQIAFLNKIGCVDSAVSQDGDIIVHGINKMYSKINYKTGRCVRYLSSAWNDAVPPAEVQKATLESIQNMTLSSTDRATKKQEEKGKKAAETQRALLLERPIWEVMQKLELLENGDTVALDLETTQTIAKVRCKVQGQGSYKTHGYHYAPTRNYFRHITGSQIRNEVSNPF